MHALLQEKRPLKRSRLGPPDVYPQEAKQREDELTPTNIKHGFTTMPPLSDEFGTAHNSNVNSVKVASFVNAVLAKKEELMTLQDSGRKKQQINCKDNFWPVSPRTKSALDAWFKDLAGNKPLLNLAKKAPSFNKKEEIFVTLCDNQVNMQRAAWFIKLSAAYTLSFTESKNKKRSIYDPAVEWTSNIIKFMRELLVKVQEYYNQSHTDKMQLPQSSTSGGVMAMPHSNSSLSVMPSVASPAGNVVNSGITQQSSNLTMPPSCVTNPCLTLNSPLTNLGLGISGIGSNFDDCRNALKYWRYCTQLSKYMYEESLLDRQEFLNWILELIDKTRTQTFFHQAVKKLILTFALQYMHDFVQSERLCRKLAYIVAKKLSTLIHSNSEMQNAKQSSQFKALTAFQSTQSTEAAALDEFEHERRMMPSRNALKDCHSCPHHHDIIMYLCTMLQIITIECPTAMVWCGVNENRISSILCGSPLDYLPLPPSTLPMPAKCERTNDEIRKQLRFVEREIVERSKHAENRWFAEKWLNTNKNCYTQILSILDHLDTYCFDRVDQSNSIEALYANIFPQFSNVRREKTANGEIKQVQCEYDPKQDETIVKILCEWAVSNLRWGDHRAIVVAILLDKRQVDVTTPSDHENYNNGNGGNGASNAAGGNNEDKDSIASGAGLIGGLPVFQSVLMDFLDQDAPILDENGPAQNRTQFTNLVHLFSTLIRYDVFSHNAYLHTLISRGDLISDGRYLGHVTSVDKTMPTTTSTTTTTLGTTGPVSNNTASPVHAFDDDFGTSIDFKHSEFDDSNVDDDLDKLLQNIKEKGQQNEAPDSPKIPDHANINCNESPISRHYIYTKHFPIPQDDATGSYSSESNQRYILLFGIGKERDEKKHAVKKMSKEISKLFSKKFSIDIAEGGKVKKHSRNEFNFESTTNKCQNMAYFDQHVVTSQCSITVLEQLNSFAAGNSNYLPVQEHVAFLFDLMEMALNIYSLLDLCDNILKELPEIEIQLQIKKSALVKSYTTSLALYIVGILRRYHCCLLLSLEQTISMFEGLCRVIKHVSSPSECNSAERCTLAYLSDLYDSCVILRSKEHTPEYFHQLNVIKKFKELIMSPEPLSITNHIYNPQFLQELFTSPKRGGKVDLLWIRQIQESSSNVYSFVSNAIVAVCREMDNDRLNDIAISCAELTASCNALSEEWIAALQSICNATKKPRYPHLFGQIDIHNSKIHNSLAVFICILVARHCFSLAGFFVNFALPTLANADPVGGEITPDAEAGARLTCHLVLKLFKTIEIPQPGFYFVGSSPSPINAANGGMFNIKLSCDRHLLVGAHKNITIEAVLAVLKAILIVVDKTALKTPSSLGTGFGNGKRSGLNTPVHPGSTPKNSDRPVDLSQILGTSDLSSLSNEQEHDFMQTVSAVSNNSNDQTSLLDFAHHVLKQICAQEHVLERCLKHADKLCDMIIDDMLTTKQVQRLLHMICYPEAEYNIISEMDQRSMIMRILENLGQWTLRISWLDLQLMYRQSMNNPAELSIWLDTVARAAIEVFQMEEVTPPPPNNGTKVKYVAKASTWLVSPLVSKLTPAVQGRILSVAGQVLESMNYFTKSKGDNNSSGSGDEREKNNSCNSNLSSCYTNYNNNMKAKRPPLNYQPFLGLILACLKGQDEYKEGLLTSLYSQLTQFLQSFPEYDRMYASDDTHGREEMLNALQVRFSLIGGMFDSIKKSGTLTMDWAILLTQLVCQGVIDHNTNKELFTTVVDMLSTLVHSTLNTDSQSDRDENKKLYLNLMKKLKKEIGEKNNSSIKVIRQLLPLYKQTIEVIACEPAGIDTKGNKICDIDKKLLRISDKQRISVWDILEGHKNPAPLSWVWFGAVKLDRKPLAFEESHRNLKYHTHSLAKPNSYFYEPLPLPPEEIEQSSDKMSIKDEMKADTPSSVDQSPTAVVSGRGRNKGTTVRKRKAKNPKTPPVNTSAASQLSQPTATATQQQAAQQQMQQQTNQSQNTQQQMHSMQMNPMQMNIQMNMQPFAQNQMMQQNPNQMVQQQMQQVPGNMQQQLNTGNIQQSAQMGYMNAASGPQTMQNTTHNQQPQWINQGQYHTMQQQQQQQQQQQPFYQQGVQMNRFERPQMNNSKQALSNMLRQRQPAFNHPNNASFNAALQQQRQAGNMQPQNQQVNLNPVQHQMQQQQFVRGPMRAVAPNQAIGNSGQSNPMAPNMGNLPMNQGMPQNPIMQSQGINPQQTSQGISMGAQNSGMMNTVGNNNTNIMNPQNSANMINNSGIIPQNVGMNVQSGPGSSGAGGPNVPQSIGQYQNFNQFQQQAMSQAGQNKQSSLMGFNQLNAQRNNPTEFIAQQQRAGIVNNRGQYMNSTPNVTMNNMMGQNGVQTYSRQQATGGKPGVVPTQQQFQQQRIHHQIMQMQGSQMNIGPQNTTPGGMGQPQNQGLGQQQNPNLVAQLQMQMPNQPNMLGQQYQHQPPPY